MHFAANELTRHLFLQGEIFDARCVADLISSSRTRLLSLSGVMMLFESDTLFPNIDGIFRKGTIFRVRPVTRCSRSDSANNSFSPVDSLI